MSSSSEETHDDDEQVSVCTASCTVLLHYPAISETVRVFVPLVFETAQGRVATFAARQAQTTPKDILTRSQESTDAGSKPSCGMFDLF